MAEKGVKYDNDKLQYNLFPPIVLKGIVEILTFGAVKYAPDNWQIVPNAKQRYTDALYRHLEEWRAGNKYDEESGKNHLYHAACCIVFLAWFDEEELKNKK